MEKRRCEPTPPLFGAPVGVMSLEFCRDFWHRKTRVPGVVIVILGLAIFVQLFVQLCTFCTTSTCDRRTDGRTDGQTDTR